MGTRNTTTAGRPDDLAYLDADGNLRARFQGVEIQTWIGVDGAVVVQVDTNDGRQHVRVNLNDGVLFDGATDTEV